LYGLPEAVCVWCQDLEEKLKLLGFIPLKSDTGMFLNVSATGFMAVDMHMDDGMWICSSEEEELKLKAVIQKFYKIKEKDTSKPFKFLGILVTRNAHQGTLKILQPEYIESMLQRYGMSDCNPVMMLVDKGSHLQNGESETYEDAKTYQALIGSLTYVAMLTHPDIGYITQYLSQMNKNPLQWDWNATKRVLRYLKGTKDLGLVFWRESNITHNKHNPVMPWGYCNADYAEDSCDWKSTSRYVCMFMDRTVSWKSKKQVSVSLSTTEAEY